MNGRQEGSLLAWLALLLVLAAALGVVVFAVVLRDDSPGTKKGETAGAADKSGGDGDGQAETPAEESAAPQGPGGEESGQKPPVEQGGPAGNDRSIEVKLAPPIESAQEAFAAVIEVPEARDWYWSVDDPRYEALDEGGSYLVRLYALLPAEGSLPERRAFFGEFRVDKPGGGVIKVR